MSRKQLATLIIACLAAALTAVSGVLTSSCTSYLITTKQATDTDVKVTSTTSVDSISLRISGSR